jgi:hypothetical protein
MAILCHTEERYEKLPMNETVVIHGVIHGVRVMPIDASCLCLLLPQIRPLNSRKRGMRHVFQRLLM